MVSARPLPARALAHPALLVLLMLALLLQGQAAALRQMLGTAHRHVPQHSTLQASAWLQAAAAWRLQLQTQTQARSARMLAHAAWQASAPSVVAHHHGSSARHHHPRSDATVVVLEPAVHAGSSPQDSNPGSASSLVQPLALAASLAWRGADAGVQHWPATAAAAWRDAASHQPERPPRG